MKRLFFLFTCIFLSKGWTQAPQVSVEISLLNQIDQCPANEMSTHLEPPGYDHYHQQVIKAEKYVLTKDYASALAIYESLFSTYDFIFLREYQVATQLAVLQKDTEKAKRFLHQGVKSGWTMKSLKKNALVKSHFNKQDWNSIKTDYKALRKAYEASLKQDLREQVKKMYKKDQWKALQALFRFGDKAKQKYGDRKFAPHSEQQMAQLKNILAEHGYPGEQLIGNSYWMAAIISHHNSISLDYVRKDTLYPEVKPLLMNALLRGQLSPSEFGEMQDWRRSITYDRQKVSYGILDSPPPDEVATADSLRAAIHLHPLAHRKQLKAFQKTTRLNFYLPAIWYETP